MLVNPLRDGGGRVGERVLFFPIAILLDLSSALCPGLSTQVLLLSASSLETTMLTHLITTPLCLPLLHCPFSNGGRWVHLCLRPRCVLGPLATTASVL